jgi:hypothetical protein
MTNPDKTEDEAFELHPFSSLALDDVEMQTAELQVNSTHTAKFIKSREILETSEKFQNRIQ